MPVMPVILPNPLYNNCKAHSMSNPYSTRSRPRPTPSLTPPGTPVAPRLRPPAPASPSARASRHSPSDSTARPSQAHNPQPPSTTAVKNQCLQTTRVKSPVQSVQLSVGPNECIQNSSPWPEPPRMENQSSRVELNNSREAYSETNILFGNMSNSAELEDMSRRVLLKSNTYCEAKKSYRVAHRAVSNGVPYRKCHSSMQQRIVSVINKIKDGKQCHKQIETLLERTRRVSTKELNNKYFVSGIQLLNKLASKSEYSRYFTQQLLTKCTECLLELKKRIVEELDKIDSLAVHSHEAASSYQKLELVRRAYRVLRKKLRGRQREEIQTRALEAAEWFLHNKITDLCLFYQELAEC